MPARAGAGNAKLVRPYAIFRSVVANESDRAMNVLLDFRDDEAGLRTMHDGKNRVTALEQRPIKSGIDGVVAGEKSAAHHEENGAAIGFLRLKHVQRQGRPKFSAVNDVLGSLESVLGLGTRRAHPGQKKDQPEGYKSSHAIVETGCEV